MTLFERLRGGSSTPTATAISANPATKKRDVAESSSFSSSRLPANDAENYDEQEVEHFWDGLIDRVNWCDLLIHELCDLRNDTPAHRADLLAVRKRMAPNLIDGDIAYLCNELANTPHMMATRRNGATLSQPNDPCTSPATKQTLL